MAMLVLCLGALNPDHANAFAQFCSECLLPKMPLNKLHQDVVFYGEIAEKADPAWKYTVRINLVIAGKKHICTGGIIENDMIVGLAHCLKNASSAEVEFLSPDGKVIAKKKPTKIEVHHRYDETTGENDIALLYLKDGIPLGFEPIEIADRLPLDEEKISFSGFGESEKGFDNKIRTAVVTLKHFGNGNGLFVTTRNGKAYGGGGDSGSLGTVVRNGKRVLVGLYLGNANLDGTGDEIFLTPTSAKMWMRMASKRLRSDVVAQGM